MSDKGKTPSASGTTAPVSKDSAGDNKKSDKDKDQKKDDKGDKKKGDLEEKSVISISSLIPLNLVVIHPLVLLSVVDHYSRVAKDTSKRVIGVLLGEVSKGKVDVTNSYAVPFEEDPKDSSSWYIDRQYHEDMYSMFKKVNAAEKIIGWYSTGPKILSVDIEINEMFRQYTYNPVFVIIDVNPAHDPLEIPTKAYYSIESTPESAAITGRREFAHLPAEIGAYEAEEVGVEHLLRNIVDTTESSLSDQINSKLVSLRGLSIRLLEINQYLTNVLTEKLPINHTILYNIQNIFNSIPDLQLNELLTNLTINLNENSINIYTANLIRTILALHDLINNKLQNKSIEADLGKTVEQRESEKQARIEEIKKFKEAEAKKGKKSSGGD